MTQAKAGLRYRRIRVTDGWAGIVCGAEGLRRSYLPEPTEEQLCKRIAAEFPDAKEDRRLQPELVSILRDYYRGLPVELDAKVDIDWSGSGVTEFQREIYEALNRTERGETLSYGELARRAGRPGAARGVGTAMARNPFPPLVPCHRVLGADGALRGYSGPGGVSLKARLLAIEGQIASRG